MAIAGLILGILAVICNIFPIVNILGWILGIIGFILALIAAIKTKKTMAWVAVGINAFSWFVPYLFWGLIWGV